MSIGMWHMVVCTGGVGSGNTWLNDGKILIELRHSSLVNLRQAIERGLSELTDPSKRANSTHLLHSKTATETLYMSGNIRKRVINISEFYHKDPCNVS